MNYADQPLCETCAARHPDAGIRHPLNHERDAWPPITWGLLALLFAAFDFPIWARALLAVTALGLLALGGSILHHELIDRPRFRSRR